MFFLISKPSLRAFFIVGFNVPGVSFQCTDKILERRAQVLTVVLTLKKSIWRKGTEHDGHLISKILKNIKNIRQSSTLKVVTLPAHHSVRRTTYDKVKLILLMLKSNARALLSDWNCSSIEPSGASVFLSDYKLCHAVTVRTTLYFPWLSFVCVKLNLLQVFYNCYLLKEEEGKYEPDANVPQQAIIMHV